MINFKLIGQRIKNSRREKNYTQEDFSELLGISTEHLSRIETGSCRPSLQLIEKICSILDVTEESLMFGEKSYGENHNELAVKLACLPKEKQQAISLIIDLISD